MSKRKIFWWIVIGASVLIAIHASFRLIALLKTLSFFNSDLVTSVI